MQYSLYIIFAYFKIVFHFCFHFFLLKLKLIEHVKAYFKNENLFIDLIDEFNKLGNRLIIKINKKSKKTFLFSCMFIKNIFYLLIP